MRLPPKAVRIIGKAVRALQDDPRARDTWRVWEERADNGDLPTNVAEVALKALNFMDAYISQSVQSARLDEDDRADLLNDLAFIRALEDRLKEDVALANA